MGSHGQLHLADACEKGVWDVRSNRRATIVNVGSERNKSEYKEHTSFLCMGLYRWIQIKELLTTHPHSQKQVLHHRAIKEGGQFQ